MDENLPREVLASTVAATGVPPAQSSVANVAGLSAATLLSTGVESLSAS
jgi:hypothetical protein